MKALNLTLLTPLAPFAAALVLAACGNLSGLDAKNSFACKAPDGVLCESMTGIYTNAQAHNLPGQRVTHGHAQTEASHAQVAASASGVLTRSIYSGTPIRSAPLVLRVWFAPWEDTDGDLHDQSYVYLPVNNGKWLIEHNRRRIQDAYRPVRAPSVQAAPAANLLEKIKVSPPAPPLAAESSFKATPQNAQEMLNGYIRPGVPGSPAQAGENEQ